MTATMVDSTVHQLARARAQLPATLMRVEANGADIEARLSGLSEPQLKVALLLSHGHSNKTIAHVLNRSGATVKAHVSAIMRALGCTNRTQAALMIYQWRTRT